MSRLLSWLLLSTILLFTRTTVLIMDMSRYSCTHEDWRSVDSSLCNAENCGSPADRRIEFESHGLLCFMQDWELAILFEDNARFCVEEGCNSVGQEAASGNSTAPLIDTKECHPLRTPTCVAEPVSVWPNIVLIYPEEPSTLLH